MSIYSPRGKLGDTWVVAPFTARRLTGCTGLESGCTARSSGTTSWRCSLKGGTGCTGLVDVGGTTGLVLVLLCSIAEGWPVLER